MSYVKGITSRDEKLLMVTHLHWIYVVEGIFFGGLIFALGAILDHYTWVYFGSQGGNFKIDLMFFEFNERHTPIPWVFGLAGFAVFWTLLLKYAATEVGLTNKRILYKTGLILIQVHDADLSDIRAESVNHGWLGWLLGYGTLFFNCRFVDDLNFPAVPKPYRFIKAAHIARMRHPEIDYSEEDLELDMSSVERRRSQAYKARRRMAKLKQHVTPSFKKVSMPPKKTTET